MGEQNFERIEWKMKKKNQLIKWKIEFKQKVMIYRSARFTNLDNT